MRIAVASGKGGTGKTTVAVNLAMAAARSGRSVHLFDCDVEAPNAHLFLHPRYQRIWAVTTPTPVVDQAACSHCGACADLCEFNALACLPEATLVFPDLCHSCGGCWLVCPRQAIAPKGRSLGEISNGNSGALNFTMGRLRLGETLVPALIRAVKAVPSQAQWIFLDAPPGTTCPVVETLDGVDFVLLVTEPTAFGLHDLDLAVSLVRQMDLPFGVIINRAELTPGPVERYCRDQGLDILARIPFRRSVAAACAEGGLAMDADPAVGRTFRRVFTDLTSREVVA